MHGEQYCAVQLPDLLQLTADAAAQAGDKGRQAALIAAVETVFASPGYLLAAFKQRLQQPAAAAAAADSPHQQQPGDAAAAAEGQQDGERQAAVAADKSSAQQQQEQRQHQVDTERIGATFSALLKLYDTEVVVRGAPSWARCWRSTCLCSGGALVCI